MFIFYKQKKAAVQTSRIIRERSFLKLEIHLRKKKEALTICTSLPLQPPIFMLKVFAVCMCTYNVQCVCVRECIDMYMQKGMSWIQHLTISLVALCSCIPIG